MTNYTNVSARAMLVSLRISTWSARKFDRSVSEKVNDEALADRDAGRFNKHLLAGASAHKAVIDASRDARTAHYAQTLPWSDEGWRLLPTSNYTAYTDALRSAHAEFETLSDALADEYPTLREAARAKLGKLYKEEDFPPSSEIRRRFRWAVEFSPVPSDGDLRVDLPDDQVSAIEKSVSDRIEHATRDAMGAAWDRLRSAVERIRRASGKTENGKRSPVYDTLIDHVKETCEMLGRLNVAEDAELDAMRARVEAELTVVAVEDLRKDDVVRADTEKRAEDIMKAMGAFYAPASERGDSV